MNTETKSCQSCKHEFVIEPVDFEFYEKMQVPPPTWCPECRMIRRMGWQGMRVLYKRPCDFTGDNLITFYHPDAPHKIYRQDIWHSDKWDPKSYGREYDPNRSFFEQWGELFRAVPLPALCTEYSNLINSDYCNAVANLKNCYLIFAADSCENCGYGKAINNCKDSFDISHVHFDELCHDILMVDKSYRTFSTQYSDECQNVWFSQDLIGCNNCIGCINLRNKSYHIFNQPVSKEEFEKYLKELDLGSRIKRDAFKKKASDFFVTQPHRQFHGKKNAGVFGDYIYNSKNVRDSYLIYGGENMRYCQDIETPTAANSYDYTSFGLQAEWMYDSVWCGLSCYNIKFSVWNYHAFDLTYCFGCHSSGNMFGCSGIQRGEYCILNKQYTKEAYLELVPKILADMTARGEYGEFLPPALSPWAYNESVGQDYYPVSKERALATGFLWREDQMKQYKDATMQIPDHIKDVSDDILKAILKCTECGKNYQIIPSELKFYHEANIPVPHHCPLCRHYAQFRMLAPITMYKRACAKCNKEIETSYAPDRPEIVYCETCYQNEVA